MNNAYTQVINMEQQGKEENQSKPKQNKMIGWLVGCVLQHINLCGLFDFKPCLFIYISINVVTWQKVTEWEITKMEVGNEM